MKMNSLFSSISILVFVFSTLISISAQEADFVAPREPQKVPGEIIVKYREGVSTEAVSILSEKLHLATVETFEFVGVQHAKMRLGSNETSHLDL